MTIVFDDSEFVQLKVDSVNDAVQGSISNPGGSPVQSSTDPGGPESLI